MNNEYNIIWSDPNNQRHGKKYVNSAVLVKSGDQREAVFKMDAKDFPEALKAVQALHGSETIGDSGGRHFSWVPYDFHEIKDFVEMLRAWRWELELDGGEVVGIRFDGEKLGDDQILFNAIAPWVKKDSYIEMNGEDGAIWRWVFDGKKCVEKSANITF